MKIINSSLLFLKKDNNICLAMKKRGHGVGKYNGVGGKAEGSETITQTMIRETQEEIAVKPICYTRVGEIKFFEYIKDELITMYMHVFIATEWVGEPQESEEMKPEWFNISDIPYDKMFEDDVLWLPLVLEGKKIKAWFEFDKEYNLLSQNIKIVDELEI